MSFSTVVGGTASNQSLTFTPVTVTSVNHTVSYAMAGQDWLRAWQQTPGQVPVAQVIFSVEVNTAGLAAGIYSAWINLLNAAGQITSVPVTLVVSGGGALTITTQSLPAGIPNTAYTAVALQATGGTGPYTWAVVSGALPAGMTLTQGGMVSGTPTLAGTFSFTVQVTDSGSNTATKPLTITVDPHTPVSVTIATTPQGLPIFVDSASFTAPQTFQWVPGSSHSLGAVAPPPTNGTRLAFANWSNGGSQTQTITVPSAAITYTASFNTLHLLTTAVAPASSGTIAASPMSPDGYYLAGTNVLLTASPTTGYQLLGWSGDASGPVNPHTLSISSPRTVTANFSCAYSLDLPSISVGSQAFTGQNGLTTGAGCPWTATSSAPWLTFTPPASGMGSVVINYSVAPNSSSESRTATFHIGGLSFTVTQLGAGACVLTLEATSLSLPATGGTRAIGITSSSPTCAWTATSADSWVLITSGSSGIGNGAVSLSVLGNPGAASRSSVLTIAGRSVVLNQTGTTNSPTSGLRFVPLEPCRIMETRSVYNFQGRSGAFGPPNMQAGETRTLPMLASNVCAVPPDAKAYIVNVTVVPRATLDFVTIWPAGEARPSFWTVRSTDGQIVANSAIVKSGANSSLSVYASNDTEVLIDINGYFTDNSQVPVVFYPLTPCRVLDTRLEYRSPAGPFGPPSLEGQATRRFQFPVNPFCVVPTGATAYSLTLTAVPQGALQFITAWPSAAPQPNVSSINSPVGRVLANNVILPASADGSIDVYAYNNSDLVIDITGYFAPDDGQRGLYYFPVTQCRASDSTVNGGPFPNETARTINIPTASGCSGIPASARGYAINVTALPHGNPMPFLTAYPTGQQRPNASILNAFQGQVTTNGAIVPAGTNGAVDIFAYRATDVVLEISGYFGR